MPTFGGLIVTNAAGAHIKGFETDFEWIAVNHLTVTGGLSILNGRYTNYPNAVPLNQNGIPGAPFNEVGNHTVVTPPVTGTLSLDYLFSPTWGALRADVTLIHNEGFFWQTDNRLTQPAYTLVNTSVTWTSPQKMYDVRVWGKNLNNSTYYIARITVAGIGDAQEQAPPRTFGIALNAHF